MFAQIAEWFGKPDPGRVWTVVLIESAVAALLGVVVHFVLSQVFKRVVRRTPWGVDDVLLQRLRPVSRVLIPLLFVMAARTRQRLADPDAFALPALDRAVQLAVIGVLTWLVAAMVAALMQWMRHRHPTDVADNTAARRVQTQVTVIGRSLQVLIVIVGLAVALMTFPLVKQVGTSLLASAGIVGLAVGIAARPVLENLIAGVQIGLTQPVRIDDVVVIEGEWGRIEEITLTYVVVKIWDERRLILPFSKVIASPFQNWTRNGSQIMGSVFLWLDYAADLAPIKAEAKRLVEASPLWDRRAFSAVVTDVTERSLQLRIVISAANSGNAWELRVALREQLLDYVRRTQPQALPRNRLDVDERRAPGSGSDERRAMSD